MIVSVPLVAVFGAVVWLAWRYMGLRTWHIMVCLLFGFLLAATDAAPQIRGHDRGPHPDLRTLHARRDVLMPPQTQRKRAVLYLRVSTRGQVDTDYDPEGISLPAQREAGKRRAAELGADIVDEYVEPGRSATTVEGRPRFQEMMARIKAERDIDYVIVYARSRMHRNGIDAAITKRDLKAAGAVLVSIMDYTEDNAVGNLVASVIDAVNEYQSQASGADISYKMAQKVTHGGSVGRASVGYLNVREKIDGREVRTVVIDPVRGPLVRMAFELYATGTYGFHDLIDTLTDAGLRMRPEKRNPAGAPISIAKLGVMLRCRYYLGYVLHKGDEFRGRHEPLISQELFDRVQEVLNSQRGGGTRARVHHHYLNGTVWCHRCQRRLMIMRGKNKRGDLYFYFICRGRQNRTCDLPYLPIAKVEEAVERSYAKVALPADLRERIATAIDRAIDDEAESNDERRDLIAKQLAKLDHQEDQFLDLVGDPDWPKDKLSERLRKVRDERARLEGQLERLERPDLDQGREAIRLVLDLLTHPDELYRRAGKRARRVLNQALFTRLYVDADEADPRVEGHEPTTPFAPFLGTYGPGNNNSPGVRVDGRAAGGVSRFRPVSRCSSSADWVEVAGIEPASFGNESGLLRVQPAWRFLSPGTHAGKLPTGSAAVCFSYRPRDRACRWSLLTMPDPGSETLPG